MGHCYVHFAFVFTLRLIVYGMNSHPTRNILTGVRCWHPFTWGVPNDERSSSVAGSSLTRVVLRQCVASSHRVQVVGRCARVRAVVIAHEEGEQDDEEELQRAEHRRQFVGHHHPHRCSLETATGCDSLRAQRRSFAAARVNLFVFLLANTRLSTTALVDTRRWSVG